ncbi:MAG: hypothetical protein JW976_14905 [Syntrophaceae bacterium]|nr:hypothetical protein [Syntrophaceae bacterium]
MNSTAKNRRNVKTVILVKKNAICASLYSGCQIQDIYNRYCHQENHNPDHDKKRNN